MYAIWQGLAISSWMFSPHTRNHNGQFTLATVSNKPSVAAITSFVGAYDDLKFSYDQLCFMED